VTYALRISPEAESDLAEAYNWYEARSPGLGLEFLRAVEASLSFVQRHPFAVQEVHGAMRRALVRRFPYGYLIEDERIVILACRHARRNPQKWPTVG